jgi:TolA-binding protein
VDEYVDFVSTIPGGANFDVNERDSLTYVAAERIYMRGETADARNSLLRYLQTFPEGAFSLNAHYYVGLIDYNQKDYESAATHLGKVLEYPNNKYSEEAMMMSADMAYTLKDYARSLDLYKLLKDKASTPELRQLVAVGMLRSASLLGNGEEIILAATGVLSDAKVNPELANEAYYYRAKALVQAGQMQHAQNDWEVLAKDTRNVYGAEAKYLLAQQLFDSGKFDAVEEEVLEFVDAGTPHVYWMARSFILLSDAYVKLDRKLEARQYLLSLKQNYQADDDISSMIESRLENLKEEQQNVTE